MRDFIEAVYEYPWTTFFIFLGVVSIINHIKEK
jgi:hypothetical protein